MQDRHPISGAKVVVMADPFSPDAFYASAQEFALSALEAHHAGNHRRVPLDAGTALEHLAKACLARRSPALLAELKNDSSVSSLIGLLRIEGAGVPAKIRTVGLSEALRRISDLSDRKRQGRPADPGRHAQRHSACCRGHRGRRVILTAFVQQADSLLADLERERGDFWGGQLSVVDALLEDASNKLAHRVEVRLAAAAAMLERRYATEGEAVIPRSGLSANRRPWQRPEFRACPVCDSHGIATAGTPSSGSLTTGTRRPAGHQRLARSGSPRRNSTARYATLRLDSQAEIEKANRHLLGD